MIEHEEQIRQEYINLIEIVKNFRGQDAYVLDAITKVSLEKPKVKQRKIETFTDVVRVLNDLSLNKL